MANYPQLDNASGVWNLREVYDAVMGGYWPNGNVFALFHGGYTPGANVEKYSFATKATPTLFGNLLPGVQNYDSTSLSSITRSIHAGGDTSPAVTDVIEYATVATGGNFADFGNLTSARDGLASVSNSIRGVIAGGSTTSPSISVSNIIDYITMATTGNATDFGDLTQSRVDVVGAGSPTRGLFAGGRTPSNVNTIDFIEIMTTGNAVDFGNLTNTAREMNNGSVCSSTRALFAGGTSPDLKTIDFVTIASQGNAIDYGDLQRAIYDQASGSNSVLGVFAAGYGGGYYRDIEEITIASGGTTTDYGAETLANNAAASGSCNAHGGLNDGYQGTRPLPFNEAGGDVGMFAGGSPDLELIQTINISSTGNAQKFGDLTTGRRQFAGGFSNKTRSLSANGYDGGSPGYPAIIEYVEFATQGNSANFGNTISASEAGSALANNTRGMYTLGVAVPAGVSNSIEYVTISTLGNAADFGNLSVARHNAAGLSSNTRGINGGGATPSLSDVIDYVTISTTGDATDFGNLSVARASAAGANSTTRGVFGGGASPTTSANINTIDYITIATTGNASDFGDLVTARRGLHGSVASNTIKGTFAGGQTPSNTDEIDQITIASTANATDFGDLMVSTNNVAASSNGHGGLVGG
jgi:hypothetical protein